METYDSASGIMWKSMHHIEENDQISERNNIDILRIVAYESARALNDIEIRTTGELRRYDIMKIIAKLAKQYEKY